MSLQSSQHSAAPLRSDHLPAETLLVAGVVLSTATKLRLSAFPVGPGEALLVLWLLIVVVRRLSRRLPPISHGSRWMVVYWIVCLVAMAAGLLVAEVVYSYRAPVMVHDVAAYALVALFSVMLSSELEAGSALRLLRKYYVVVVVVLGALLLVALRGGPMVDQMWYSTRFSGWAKDPNQVAFQVAAAPFVLLHFATQEAGTRRWWLLALAILAVVIGVYSGSDSLLAAWPAAAVIGLVALYAQRFRRRGGTYWSGVIKSVLLPATLVGVAVIAGPAIYNMLSSEASTVFNSMDQGAVRVALWTHGLEAFMMSPLVGLGPGAHSGVFAALSGGEAHNSYIQWAANAGAVGLVSLVVLIGGLFRRTWARESHWLVMVVAGYAVLMLFHTALRHPSLWLTLAILHSVTLNPRQPDKAQAVESIAEHRSLRRQRW